MNLTTAALWVTAAVGWGIAVHLIRRSSFGPRRDPRRDPNRHTDPNNPAHREPSPDGVYRCARCHRGSFTQAAVLAHWTYYHLPRPGPEDHPEWSNHR